MRTLPFSVSKVLPPFGDGVASGAAAEEPSTSLRLGPAGPLRLRLLRHRADFLQHRVGVLVTGLELVADLRRNSAFGRIGFDVFDHLDFGLAEISDQLAGLVRRRMAVARGLDQLAALLRLFAQGNEPLHAGIRRTARRRRRPALERRAGDRRGAAGGKCGRRSAVDRRKCGIVGLAGLIGQRRGERALREGLTHMEGDGGNGQRHNQAADDHGCFSGKVQRAPTSSDRSATCE